LVKVAARFFAARCERGKKLQEKMAPLTADHSEVEDDSSDSDDARLEVDVDFFRLAVV
jgi:hypothetical protein